MDRLGGRARHFQLQGFVGVVGGQREAPRWRPVTLIDAEGLHAANQAGVVAAIATDAEEAAGDEPFVLRVGAAGDKHDVHGERG